MTEHIGQMRWKSY